MLDAYFNDFCAWLEKGDRMAVEGYLTDTRDAPALAVYRNGFLKTCTDALAANHPTIRPVVGEDYFRSLALGYVHEHPPSQSTLIGYGEMFADYIANEFDQHGLGYLSDLAVLDRGWLRALYASEAETLSAERLMDAPDVVALSVRLKPSVQLVDTQFDAYELWRRLREQGEISQQVTLERSHSVTLFWREDNNVLSRMLGASEVTFLRKLETSTLGEAAEAALADDEGFSLDEHFAALIAHELLTEQEQ